MSRSLSSIIREYEQLQGGRLVEVRRWHNFLLRGGQITTCTVTIDGQPVKFDVDKFFIHNRRLEMNPRRNDPKLVLEWLTSTYCATFIKAIIRSISFFTQDYKDQICIIKSEDPLHLGDVKDFAVAYKNIKSWIPKFKSIINSFYFKERNPVYRHNVNDLYNFKSVLGCFPCHADTIDLYKKINARALQIIRNLPNRKRIQNFKAGIQPYLDCVTETIRHLENAPQELINLENTLKNIETIAQSNKRKNELISNDGGEGGASREGGASKGDDSSHGDKHQTKRNRKNGDKEVIDLISDSDSVD